MNDSAPSWLLTVILRSAGGLLLYRRFRNAFVRQPISAPKMMMRMGLLALVALLLLSHLPTAAGFMAASAGATVGLLLALVGLSRTRFEASAQGIFYTPNKWIGLVVSALLISRIAARAISIYQASAAMAEGAAAGAVFQRSPLTVGIFFVMAAYYIVYYAGVLRKGRRLGVPQAPPA